MPDKKLHIAMLSTWFPSPESTSGIFVRDQADALTDAGNKVAVFMFRYFSLMAWLKKKLKGEPLSDWLRGRNTEPFAFNYVNLFPSRFSTKPIETEKKAFLKYAAKCFANYIKTNGKPDVIHHHGVADFCYITAHLSKTFGIPYLITEHSMFIDKVDHFTIYETKEERLAMIQGAASRITVSTFYKEFNESIFHAPFVTIHNMISNDFISPALPSFPKKTSPFYFMNIGALSRRKRQDILIKAFAAAFKNNTQVHLTIAGNGELEGELKELIPSLNMQEQIHLTGYITRNKIISLLDTSQVVVISSEKESFSMAAAEAMFRGNPVLSTECKGPEDFITTDNGMLCKLNDVEDMKDKMLKMYANYSAFNHKEISKKAIEQFSEHAIVKKLEELYRDIIALKK